MEKRDVLHMYHLPEEVKYCKKCTISNQRPRITFDENGVCSACNYRKFKNAIGRREKKSSRLCVINSAARMAPGMSSFLAAAGKMAASWLIN